MKTLVLIPTYNEKDNIPILVTELMSIPGVSVMVLDDQSPDGTGKVADELGVTFPGRVQALHRTGQRGLGVSYLEGFHRAIDSDYDFVCQMDADLSHDPADLRRMLEAAPQADLIVGSRYVEGGRVINWPRRRRALSAFANWYVRAITGVGISDCTSGFRCWSRPLAASLDLRDVRSDGYAFLVELAWKAWRAGGRVLEVPITFVERREGASKLSWRVIGESVLLPWQLVTRRDRSPEPGARSQKQ